MKSEKDIISLIAQNLPRSERQINPLFESDSEILNSSEGILLFTVDDYSEEDHFPTFNPYNLGWNLAVATVSDIYASGGIPAYFAHSMAINNNWHTEYILKFVEGIKDVLHQSGSYFLGGDFGYSTSWHYTGIALGKSIRVLTRRGAKPGDTFFMTGYSGCGNLYAALGLFDPEYSDTELIFELRNEEAKLISKFASACIDSSDGIINSLMTISEINDSGFEITNPNINPQSLAIAQQINLTPELLLLGECGEYELVFSVSKEDTDEFLDEASKHNLNFTAIGKVKEATQKQLQTPSKIIDLQDFTIKGRNFKEETEYIEALNNYIRQNGKDNSKWI